MTTHGEARRRLVAALERWYRLPTDAKGFRCRLSVTAPDGDRVRGAVQVCCPSHVHVCVDAEPPVGRFAAHELRALLSACWPDRTRRELSHFPVRLRRDDRRGEVAELDGEITAASFRIIEGRVVERTRRLDATTVTTIATEFEALPDGRDLLIEEVTTYLTDEGDELRHDVRIDDWCGAPLLPVPAGRIVEVHRPTGTQRWRLELHTPTLLRIGG